MNQAELLAEQIEGTRDWTRKLIADLVSDDWFFQAAPGLAHSLWLIGHLTVSQDTLVHVRCLQKPILDDAFKKHFPIGGPVKSVKEYAYPSTETVLKKMEEIHRATIRAVRGMSDALLAEPAYAADGKSSHPHYRDKRGAVSHCSRHEAFHAGQLAMIRRLLGRPFLR